MNFNAQETAVLKRLAAFLANGHGASAEAPAPKKRGRKAKAAMNGAAPAEKLTGAKLKAQKLLDGRVDPQSAQGKTLQSIINGKLDARKLEAREALGRKKAVKAEKPAKAKASNGKKPGRKAKAAKPEEKMTAAQAKAKTLIDSGKAPDGRTPEGKTIRGIADGKIDARSKEGRAVRHLLNGKAAPAAKAKAKAEKPAKAEKEEKPGRKKSADGPKLSGARAKAQKLLDGGVAPQSARGQVLKSIIDGKLDARKLEAREALGRVKAEKPAKEKPSKKAEDGSNGSESATPAAVSSEKLTAAQVKARALIESGKVPEGQEGDIVRGIADGKIDARSKDGRSVRHLLNGEEAPPPKAPKAEKVASAGGDGSDNKSLPGTLSDRIATVMGTDELRAAEVVERLKAKGWMPASNDPVNLVSWAFSQNPHKIFEKVKRGVYKVSAEAKTTKVTDTPKPAKSETKVAATAAPAPSAPQNEPLPSDEEMMASLGMEMGEEGERVGPIFDDQ
jgi:hypothetical protein